MLARSTASRHGDGRTCAKATSMTTRWPSGTSRLAGLMSRWARPASHSRRTMRRPSSMIVVVDLGVADLDGAVEELGDEQVLALGGQLDDAVAARPSGCRRRASAAARSPRTATRRRTDWKGASSSSRPYRIVRPSLYQRSARTWFIA